MVKIANLIILALITIPTFHIGLGKVYDCLGIGFSPHVANLAALFLIGLCGFLSFRKKG
jgi:hypothetical protein